MKRNSDGGYVMGWVLIMTAVLMILVTAILTVSAKYHEKSVRHLQANQAYYTARSVVELMAADFVREDNVPGEAAKGILAELENYGDEITDIRIEGLGEAMGDCSIHVKRIQEEGSLMITAAAAYGGSEARISVVLLYDMKDEDINQEEFGEYNPIIWKISHYQEG